MTYKSMYQVAAFHITACSDEELQKISAYVDELLKRLNEATDDGRGGEWECR